MLATLTSLACDYCMWYAVYTKYCYMQYLVYAALPASSGLGSAIFDSTTKTTACCHALTYSTAMVVHDHSSAVAVCGYGSYAAVSTTPATVQHQYRVAVLMLLALLRCY